MRKVATIIAKEGLVFIPEGSGIAKKQTPEAGKIVDKGSKVTIYFE